MEVATGLGPAGKRNTVVINSIHTTATTATASREGGLALDDGLEKITYADSKQGTQISNNKNIKLTDVPRHQARKGRA